ncbi:MAG: hypothetical protein IJM38_00280 [Ruminococcus sp.]|nr:hypothetical protein [Ruminococcus sp.]
MKNNKQIAAAAAFLLVIIMIVINAAIKSGSDKDESSSSVTTTEAGYAEVTDAETEYDEITEEKQIKTTSAAKSGKKKKTAATTVKKTKASKTKKAKTTTVTTTVTPTEAPWNEGYVEYHFRTQKQLNQHFEKHGGEFKDDFGYKTAEEYEKGASDVINDPSALYKTESEDGDGVYYLEATNEFVILSTDGYIRTYFRPNGGKKYFDRQ